MRGELGTVQCITATTPGRWCRRRKRSSVLNVPLARLTAATPKYEYKRMPALSWLHSTVSIDSKNVAQFYSST